LEYTYLIPAVVFNPIAKGRQRMAPSKIKAGNLSDVDGEVKLAGHDFYEGFTTEQVSVPHAQITARVLPCNQLGENGEEKAC